MLDNAQQRQLLFHGLVILFLGLLAGIGFSVAATGPVDAPSYGRWRFAHMEGLLNGLLVIAIAGGWPVIQRGGRLLVAARWALILGCYANIVGPILNALLVPKRLIVPETALEALIVYGFYIPGTLPILAVPVFIYAVLANRRAP
ncbi:hypothetical protein [Spongiibacter sp.]|uniref:hypothetical protein n=1 Tax=Spongiibacter sp. TaxID=2024860 RepID=UPI003563AF38